MESSAEKRGRRAARTYCICVALAVTSDNKYIVSGSGSGDLSPGTDNTVRIWSFQQNKQIAALEGHNHAVFSLAVRTWRLQGELEKVILPGHTLDVTHLQVTSDKKYVLSYSSGTTV